jgi:hypothetical protein
MRDPWVRAPRGIVERLSLFFQYSGELQWRGEFDFRFLIFDFRFLIFGWGADGVVVSGRLKTT